MLSLLLPLKWMQLFLWVITIDCNLRIWLFMVLCCHPPHIWFNLVAYDLVSLAWIFFCWFFVIFVLFLFIFFKFSGDGFYSGDGAIDLDEYFTVSSLFSFFQFHVSSVQSVRIWFSRFRFATVMILWHDFIGSRLS